MKVLVTGGTGVVGQAAVTALVNRGHAVRLFSRHAVEDVRQWPSGVEPRAGSVSELAEVRNAADSCDVVVHLAGVVSESPPEVTFENTNVDGTRHIVREAERARVGRFIYVSSLGADRGESDYHRSKRKAEEIARTFQGAVTILRPGNVYGPGDEIISLLLKMVRTLPAIPVIDGGDQPFQPLWVDDLGLALAMAVERTDLAGRTLELAGAEHTSMNDLLDQLGRLTGRTPVRVPLPGALASVATKTVQALGVDFPITDQQLTMLAEGNVIEDPSHNALTAVFRITPTPLDAGLRTLADSLPELLPSDGVGGLKRKRFWADIVGCATTPEALFDRFRHRFAEITPWHLDVGAEPGTPTEVREGETLTMGLPMRGNIQVRVAEVTPRRLTLLTVEGHPLAGAVRFLCEPQGSDVTRFEVQVYDRAANRVDWVLMRTVGDPMQNATWESLVERVVAESGGQAPGGVEQERTTLDEQRAEEIERWLADLVMERKREERQEEATRRPRPRP